LTDFAPGKQLEMVITHSDGATHTARLDQTYSPIQIEWFKAGSALNLIAKI
jgi:aconitate hydratase